MAHSYEGTIYCYIYVYLIISSQYKVILCLKKYSMSKNHMICKVCYRWRNATLTRNSMQKLARHCQSVNKFQNKTNAHTVQYDKDAKQTSRVFYLFCLISQGILYDCVTTSIRHLHPLINWAIYSCSNGDAAFIQSSDSLRLTILQTDEQERETGQWEKERVSRFLIVCNNDLWIKSKVSRDISQRMWDGFRPRESGKEWIWNVKFWIT